MSTDYVARIKFQYLRDVEAGNGKNWTVVMGNEAGDLDTMASALAYAWLGSKVHKSLHVPMIQTLRSDLHLRAENTYALSMAGFHASQQELLCIDDLSKFPSFPSNKFALVDHNRLGSQFSAVQDATVVAVVDHHADEGLYKDTANPRIIVVPTGSCSSLVAALIEKQCPDDMQIPPNLATLLLSSIVIDTNGLKPGGKAEKTDIQAATYLLPRSTLASSSHLLCSIGHEPKPRVNEVPCIVHLANTLRAKKSSVSHLGTRDLFRRDFKGYSFLPSWDPASPIQLGLASVPMGIKPWVSRDHQFWNSVEQWMTERDLDAFGILTSYRVEKKSGEEKHKREMLMVVKTDAAKGGLASRLWSGLEGSTELELVAMKKLDEKAKRGLGCSFEAQAYKQRNTSATRKVIAPLLKTTIEGSLQT